MEIVLSPGRFGDETPGVPFQKEEIREWSHVDRLTGMLERARIETGRWQSSNQEAAKSYGKVIDSRERNSADGSVVQRARRQVEIFQSQGRGRSVQVVRASQWSSSRVTDSASTGPSILPLLDRKRITQGEDERNTGEKSANAPRPAVETKNDRRSRQEAISERLSALLGAFPYPSSSSSSSSTVPLRRIDSRYSSRAPIIFANAKRSNSNEDLAIFARENTTNGGQDRVEKIATDEDPSMPSTSNVVASTRERDDDVASVERCNNGEESTCKPARSAIQLLPFSKSNTTVVNLMGDTRTRRDSEIFDDKRTDLDWLSQTPPKNPQRDGRNEDPASLPIACQKLPKRVGFCKTEIHFVVDSGKVNIVETDEKPPPTNKFRRKKRFVASNKISPPSSVVSADDDSVTYETTKINEEDAPDASASALLTDRELEPSEKNSKNEQHRGHTTTVKLGTESTRDQDREGQFCKGEGEASMPAGAREASSQGIVLRLENRIYDRLEAYTTEIQARETSISKIPPRHEYAIARTDIHQIGALKSARLVMNLTRVPQSSRVIVEPAIAARVYEIDRGKEFAEVSAHDDVHATSARLDGWKNEGKTKSSKRATHDEEKIFVDNRDVDRSRGFVDKIEETENICEINETLTIGKEPLERAGSSEPDKKVSSSTKSKRRDDTSTEDYDVVCTDAENNQVVLKVVTTHEPTIARVAESNDRFSKRVKKPAIKARTSKKGLETPERKKSQTEHTYVNVFTSSSKNVPIYENFRVTNTRKVDGVDSLEPMKKEGKSCPEKLSRVTESKSQISQTCDSSVTAHLEKTRSSVDERTTAVTRAVASPIAKKVAQSSTGNSRPRAGRVARSETDAKRAVKSDVSSNERDSRLSDGNHDEKLEPSSRSCTREISSSSSSSRTRNNNEIIRRKPMEVVYQTAVYNMKNEKLSKPHKKGNKESSRGPRYINELICGAKTKSRTRSGDSKSKTSGTVPHQNKGASQTNRHWK